MGMFSSYENINPNYQPNNFKPVPQCKPEDKLEPLRPDRPYEEYNAKGELIGYYWYYGNAVTLHFDVTGEVSLLDDGTYIPAKDFMSTTKVSISILDFRNQVVAEQTVDGSTSLDFHIDENLSKKIVRGTYHCSVTIWKKDGFNKTIFSSEDATLIVK